MNSPSAANASVLKGVSSCSSCKVNNSDYFDSFILNGYGLYCMSFYYSATNTSCFTSLVYIYTKSEQTEYTLLKPDGQNIIGKFTDPANWVLTFSNMGGYRLNGCYKIVSL